MKKVKFSNPAFWGRTFQNSSIGEWSVDADGIVETDEVAYFVDGFGCEVVADEVVGAEKESDDAAELSGDDSAPEKGKRGRKPKTAND